MQICICGAGHTFDVEAIACRLEATSVQPSVPLPASCTHVVWLGPDGIALGLPGSKVPAATRVDFMDGTLQYRLRTSGKRQGLGKAVGLDKAAGIRVLDATAGLGRDALVLAHLGCEVEMVEKSPVMQLLLEDGLTRARRQADASFAETLRRMTLVAGDSREIFAAIAAGTRAMPDVIYLDPMFPPREKSASVKKDIAMLQSVLGVEEDFPGLLAAALPCARHRVVVKRPGSRLSEDARPPTFVVPGKSAHFEVYVNSSFSSMRR